MVAPQTICSAISMTNNFSLATPLRARKQLKDLTTKDVGNSATNRIFVSERLTKRKNELFRKALYAKKDKGFKFIWTSSGKIFLKKDENSDAIHISPRANGAKRGLLIPVSDIGVQSRCSW